MIQPLKYLQNSSDTLTTPNTNNVQTVSKIDNRNLGSYEPKSMSTKIKYDSRGTQPKIIKDPIVTKPATTTDIYHSCFPKNAKHARKQKNPFKITKKNCKTNKISQTPTKKKKQAKFKIHKN